MNASVTKKRLKFIWILFHAVILKSQRKAFRQLLNFFNYFQFWAAHCKLNVIICLTFKIIVCCKQKEITKKNIKSSGPNMEPCGSPCSKFIQLVNIFCIFIFRFRGLKGFLISISMNFCYQKIFGKQSNAFGKSDSKAPGIMFLSRNFFPFFSYIANELCCPL